MDAGTVAAIIVFVLLLSSHIIYPRVKKKFYSDREESQKLIVAESILLVCSVLGMLLALAKILNDLCLLLW